MPLPHDYAERVYAGVLGKIIGVYLGRPFEGASYEQLTREFGEVNYYVHEQRNVPLVVTDDDISGTFTFLRALPDYGNSRDITARQIGQSWLNYIIENRAILWWGGMGMSTEHTAFLRLKNGIPAPQSGSIAVNGKVVAEQIGAQIFIDGCGLVAPGDPEFAADLARRFASVSHDGEAIYGAQVVAAMEALAFIENDIQKLLDVGLRVIPNDSVIYRLISDLREWHAHEDDWRKTREQVAAHYGYDKYTGGCHMVPNHALIIHALLHGDGDFQKSLMIVNTCGWDTDCNSGNVGCLLGIRGGLAALDSGPDFRGPVADRMYLPTADGGRGVTDALTEAYRVINISRALHGESEEQPKNGARFHFSQPGAVQGFVTENLPESRGTTRLENVERNGERVLAMHYSSVATGRPARVATGTFLNEEALQMGGYGLLASPTLYPGQTVRAKFSADGSNGTEINCRLYLRAYDENKKLLRFYGPQFRPPARSTGDQTTLDVTWQIDGDALDLHGLPIAEIGVEILANRRADGTLYLHSLTWDGAPKTTLQPRGEVSRKSWVNGADSTENWWGGDYRVKQNAGRGLLINGTREWTNYRVSATLSAHLARSFGLAARVQGMKRFYALLLTNDGRAQLVKALDGEKILSSTDFEWHFDADYEFELRVSDDIIQASINGKTLLEVQDDEAVLEGGGIALVCEEGHIKADNVKIAPA